MNGRNSIWSWHVFYVKQRFFFSSKNLKYSQAFYLQNIFIPIKLTQVKNSTDSKHFFPVRVVYITLSKIKRPTWIYTLDREMCFILVRCVVKYVYSPKHDYRATKHCVFSQKHIQVCRWILCFCEILNNIENVYKLVIFPSINYVIVVSLYTCWQLAWEGDRGRNTKKRISE
jgi:hypothetical protein